MIFKMGNGIKCGQDHGQIWYSEIPADIDFVVKIDSPFNIVKLVGYGYGQLEPHTDKSYGNGALYPYGLTEDHKKTFELA